MRDFNGGKGSPKCFVQQIKMFPNNLSKRVVLISPEKCSVKAFFNNVVYCVVVIGCNNSASVCCMW